MKVSRRSEIGRMITDTMTLSPLTASTPVVIIVPKIVDGLRKKFSRTIAVIMCTLRIKAKHTLYPNGKRLHVCHGEYYMTVITEDGKLIESLNNLLGVGYETHNL